MSKIKLELKNVKKAFGDNKVLNGVNLKVETGKSMVVIGGSGTGKSVMLKCVLGLLNPDSGSILLDGKETVGVNNRDRDQIMHKFGMLFQGAALFDSLKVWENIAFRLVQNKMMNRKDARDLAIEKIISVGLRPDVVDLYPAELSGGMQKRVGLARAIAANPEIIFFDEPTTGLDPIMAEVINELINKSVKELGATALSITHDMQSVRKIADHVAMIHEGEILWTGTVEEMDTCDNEYVQQFIHGRADGPIQRRVA
ncbi:ABC transporter ATP-binding protein [Alphaproteobacteria bacterium]|nr:ABC transporter ATP-binding protein [Alphaproteobacteria bacterium]